MSRDDDDKSEAGQGGAPGQDEPSPNEADASPPQPGSAGETDPSGPADPFGLGFDPEQAARDPFGTLFRVMGDPKARQAFEQFVSSKMGQDMLARGLQSPLVQQVMNSNPMLRNLMQQAGGDMPTHFDLSSLLGGLAPRPTPPQPPAEEPADELDEPVLPLLDPARGGPPFPDPSPMSGFAALLVDAPEDVQTAIAKVAKRRARHHLGREGLARLQAFATERGVENPVDLLVAQGAFAGEVAWYAICRLEDKLEPESFVPLARHALRCVTYACGFRVPSFVNQLLAFLLDLGVASDEDVRHVTWALSGQPEDGVDGVFEITWDDVDELVDGLAARVPDNTLLAAALAALVGWRELDQSERPSGLGSALDRLPEARRAAVLDVLGALAGDARELQGLRGRALLPGLSRSIALCYAEVRGIDAALTLRQTSWSSTPPPPALTGLLEALDIAWPDATPSLRNAFVEAMVVAEDEGLRALAYRVAAAWVPHEYLDRAAEDRSAAIRAWASEELKSLRG